MPAKPSGPHLQRVSRQWHDLAERRLAYFLELYRSGRWKHYYTPQAFAARMLDVIKATQTWRELAAPAPAPAHMAAQANTDLRPAA